MPAKYLSILIVFTFGCTTTFDDTGDVLLPCYDLGAICADISPNCPRGTIPMIVNGADSLPDGGTVDALVVIGCQTPSCKDKNKLDKEGFYGQCNFTTWNHPKQNI